MVLRLGRILLILTLTVIGCGQEKKYHDQVSLSDVSDNEEIIEILRFQRAMDDEFRNPETSPLRDRDRKNFEGLEFYPPDTNYIVRANFARTPDAKPFLMPTTTDRKTEEVVYGIASFELNGKQHELEVYQSLGLLDQKEYEDYLFLPFLDETNGEETYGGGRYIDLSIPEGNVLVIDFNRAYNPYCVYNKKYSCPLVPRQNYLRTSVKAGVKAFGEN